MSDVVQRGGIALLAALLLALAGAAFVDHRPSGAALVPGEATTLMQALSLLEDGDLAYEREDFDRLLLSRGANPTDLDLVSASDGRRITFDRPFPYALYLAPFLAFWPQQGAALANVFLLILVCLFSTWTLTRRLGAPAASWVAVLVFCSVLFVYVFQATPELFFWAATVLSFGLLTSQEESVSGRRLLLAGALLSLPLASKALFAVLLVGALAQPAVRRQPRAFFGGLAGAWLVQGLVRWWAGGGLGPLGATRFRFTPETGYPLVDFTALEWAPTVHRMSAFHWHEAPRFSWGVDPGLWSWDVVYLLLGQNTGLLPYFPGLLLLILAGSLRRGRRGLALMGILWMVAIVIRHPFDFWGGPGVVANRYFLPVYGALWWLLDRPDDFDPRRRLGLWVSLPALLLATLFLPRLWVAPWGPSTDPGSGRHVTELARQRLPFETSQRWLPGSPVEEHLGLSIRFLDENAWAESRRQRLVLDGAEETTLMIAAGEKLEAVRLDFGPEAPSRIEVRGGSPGELMLRSDGGVSFLVELGGWTRRHPTWWTPEPRTLHLLSLRLPGASDQPLPFRLERQGNPTTEGSEDPP